MAARWWLIETVSLYPTINDNLSTIYL